MLRARIYSSDEESEAEVADQCQTEMVMPDKMAVPRPPRTTPTLPESNFGNPPATTSNHDVTFRGKKSL